jgi:flagellar protein FliL
MASKPKAAAAATAEAEQEETDGAAEQSAAKKRFALPSMKVLIIAGAALLVVVGGGGGAYFMFFKGGGAEAKPAAEKPKPVVFVDLPEVLVNLSSAGSDRAQYLKAKVVLELADQAMVAQIQPVMPRVMDSFQTYLRELRASDLDGSAGLYRLKEELTRRVNVAIAPGKINAVLFKEIIVQ